MKLRVIAQRLRKLFYLYFSKLLRNKINNSLRAMDVKNRASNRDLTPAQMKRLATILEQNEFL